MNNPAPLTLNRLKSLIDAAIPLDWTRVYPTESRIQISAKIKLPDETREINLAIESIRAQTGEEVTIYLKPVDYDNVPG